MTMWTERVAFQLHFPLQHFRMQPCMEGQNPALKQTAMILSAYLLAEFAAASLAAQLCPNLVHKRFLGISVPIPCSSFGCCDLLLCLLGILTSSKEGAPGRESFPITPFPALQRRPEDNLVVMKLRDHTCSSPLRLTWKITCHYRIWVQGPVCPKRGVICGTSRCGPYFSDLRSYNRCSCYVVILRKGFCWPLWAPGLSSSCSCGKRIHIIIIMESSFCRFSLHHLGTSSQGSISQSVVGFRRIPSPNHHPSVCTVMLSLLIFTPSHLELFHIREIRSCFSADHCAFP